MKCWNLGAARSSTWLLWFKSWVMQLRKFSCANAYSAFSSLPSHQQGNVWNDRGILFRRWYQRPKSGESWDEARETQDERRKIRTKWQQMTKDSARSKWTLSRRPFEASHCCLAVPATTQTSVTVYSWRGWLGAEDEARHAFVLGFWDILDQWILETASPSLPSWPSWFVLQEFYQLRVCSAPPAVQSHCCQRLQSSKIIIHSLIQDMSLRDTLNYCRGIRPLLFFEPCQTPF